MSVDDNRRANEVIMNLFMGKVPLDRAADYIAENCVDHQGMPGMDTNGLEGFKRMANAYQSAFPDMAMETTFTVAEGNYVATHVHFKGTNTGSFAGIPSTGKSIDIEGIDIVRFADGKAVEHWGYLEESKMMEQLGLMPAQR